MFDYYAHVLEMNEEKLVLEIEKLTKRIVATNPTSPIFNQLKSYLDMANSVYNDRQVARRVKTEDTVLDIGEMESVEYTPDYSKKEILEELVKTYTEGISRGPKGKAK